MCEVCGREIKIPPSEGECGGRRIVSMACYSLGYERERAARIAAEARAENAEAWAEGLRRENAELVNLGREEKRAAEARAQAAEEEAARLRGALENERQWTHALGADSRKLQAQLDAVATALGIKGRNDTTDLVSAIAALAATKGEE
jgi:hypothetical protein